MTRAACANASLKALMILTLLGASLLPFHDANAQQGPAADRAITATKAEEPRPWFYADSDVPMDQAWRFGVLPNGLRYAIRHNDIPARMVSIRVQVDVGSLMERRDEAGHAHFIEHLSFRGSRDVPDGESKRIWQRLGAEFGVDSNAQTSPTQTSFSLNLPDASQAGLDESLKILASMVSAPNIVPQAVDAERAVVMAERRESLGPGTTLGNEVRAFFFSGQPLGDHSPIGSEQTLQAATTASLRAFHDRWYRPDRTVIAISGDADPVILEGLIKKHFANWRAVGPVPTAPDFGRPIPSAPSTHVVVSPDVPVSIRLAYLRPWRFQKDTIAFNQARAVDDLALELINRRLKVAATSGMHFLAADVLREDSARSASATFVNILPLGNDWETPLREVRAIIEDARLTLPSVVDIDREFKALDGIIAQAVATSSLETSAMQADNLISAVDIRETIVTPQAQQEIYRSARRLMTPERVRDSTRRMFTGDAIRAVVSIKAPDARAAMRLTAAMRVPVRPARNARLAARQITIESLPSLPPAGRVVGKQMLDLLGIERITFENGTTLFVTRSDNEPGKVRIAVRFGHGLQSFSANEKTALWAAPVALMASGIGNLDENALDELGNGRQLSLQFGIDDDAFVMSALTSPQDYRDQLRLFASKLAFPRWSAVPLQRALATLKLQGDDEPDSAQDALDRRMQWLLRDKDERFASAMADDAALLTLDRFKEIWEPRLATGPIEIQLYGDLDKDEAIAAVAATFGALPVRPKTVAPGENKVLHFPAKTSSPVYITHNGPKEQAAVVIAWPTGGGEARLREGRQLSVLARIIEDRLFEKLRSNDGVAYTPSAANIWPITSPSGGYLKIETQLRPERIPYFLSMVDVIAADLRQNPVSSDELKRQLESLRQFFSRAVYSSSYWMNMLGGLSRNPGRLQSARTMAPDTLTVTPADLQSLAQRYLTPDAHWSAIILPKGVPMPDLASPKTQVDKAPPTN